MRQYVGSFTLRRPGEQNPGSAQGPSAGKRRSRLCGPGFRHTVHLCTHPLSPARERASRGVSSLSAAHLQCSDRASDSELTLRSHRKHRVLPRRLRKRCVGSLSRAELSHSCDVPHRGVRQGRVRPSVATQSAAQAAGAAGPRAGMCAHIPPAPALAVGRPSGGPGASGCYMLRSDKF